MKVKELFEHSLLKSDFYSPEADKKLLFKSGEYELWKLDTFGERSLVAFENEIEYCAGQFSLTVDWVTYSSPPPFARRIAVSFNELFDLTFAEPMKISDMYSGDSKVKAQLVAREEAVLKRKRELRAAEILVALKNYIQAIKDSVDSQK